MITKEVVNKAIDYILAHLQEELTVEMVASHCHFSKYYFSRVFKMETGESVYGFIKRVKIERSAVHLKSSPDSKITDIGYQYGYDPANYSTVFKKHHEMSPYLYRKQHDSESNFNPFSGKVFQYLDYQAYNRLISIEIVEDMSVVYERHIGSYQSLAEHWYQFKERYKDQFTDETKFLERSYDDPTVTDIDQCICDICFTSLDSMRSDGDHTKDIEGGRFAVYHFDGPSNKIFEAFQGIFNVWIPGSQYQLDDRVGFDIYQSVDIVRGTFKLDIYIPIK